MFCRPRATTILSTGNEIIATMGSLLGPSDRSTTHHGPIYSTVLVDRIQHEAVLYGGPQPADRASTQLDALEGAARGVGVPAMPTVLVFSGGRAPIGLAGPNHRASSSGTVGEVLLPRDDQRYANRGKPTRVRIDHREVDAGLWDARAESDLDCALDDRLHAVLSADAPTDRASGRPRASHGRSSRPGGPAVSVSTRPDLRCDLGSTRCKKLVDGEAVSAFKASGDITSMSRADGFVEIPPQTDIVEKGEIVVVKLF